MESETRRHVAILDAIEDGLYICDRDYTIEFMNKALIKVFGDSVGQKCHRLFNYGDEKCPWCRAEKVFERGETTHHELTLPKLDKTFDMIGLPVRTAAGIVSKLTICRDITWRKKQEKKLKASKEDYNRLFEHVACGVFISTKEGKFVDANQALLDMLGYESKEEFLALDITHDLYLHPGDRQRFIQEIEKYGHVIDYEVQFKRKDKTPLPILLTGHARYDSAGNIIGYEGLNVDLSQRKQIEAELKETQMQLLQAEKMTSLGKLAAGVAHQLNNPLGGVILYTKLILEEYELADPIQEDLKRILRDAQRCRDTVKELLEFTRQTRQLMRPHNINAAVARTLFLLENQTLFHNIEINKTLADALPPIQADIQQLYHLLMNIILNAAEAMNGNGALSIKTYLSKPRNRVCIEISDTGPGIPEAELAHIFEPFFTTKEEGKGTGLGLSLAYGIVENHGGTILARNNPSGGTSFLIEFPINAEPGESADEHI